MKKKIDFYKFKVHHFPWILALVVVFLLTLAVLFYQVVGERTEQALLGQVKAQELTLARSGALALTKFFEDKKVELLFLAEMETVKSGREECKEALESAVDHFYKEGRLFVDVVRIDREGNSAWAANINEVRKGKEFLGDRDYFSWAKKQKEPGEVFVDRPVIARGGTFKGETSIVMATPVFYGREFNGLVLIGFSLEDLTENYIVPLGVSPQVHSLLLTEEGMIVSSTLPRVIGKNFLDCVEEKGNAASFLQEMVEVGRGSKVHHCALISEKERKLITAYSPVKVDGARWYLLISLPYSGVVNLAWPFRRSRTEALTFVLIGICLLCVVFIFGVRMAQREAFIDGFKNRRNGTRRVRKKRG